MGDRPLASIILSIDTPKRRLSPNSDSPAATLWICGGREVSVGRGNGVSVSAFVGGPVSDGSGILVGV